MTEIHGPVERSGRAVVRACESVRRDLCILAFPYWPDLMNRSPEGTRWCVEICDQLGFEGGWSPLVEAEGRSLEEALAKADADLSSLLESS